jgi:hypothetical protein
VHRLLCSWVENVNFAFTSTDHANTAIGSHCSGISELPILHAQVFAELLIAEVILLEFELEFTFSLKSALLFIQPKIKKFL